MSEQERYLTLLPGHQSVPTDPTQSKLYLLLKILNIEPDFKEKVCKGNISIPWLLGLTCTDNVQWLRGLFQLLILIYFISRIM